MTRTLINNTTLLGRPDASSALMRKFRAEMGLWTAWLVRNGVNGIIGEFGWPNALINADTVAWGKLGDKFIRMLYNNNIPFFIWSCQEEYSLPAPPLVIYSSLPPASGAPISLIQSEAPIFERYQSSGIGGINFDGNSQLYLLDGGFDGGSRFYGVANGSGQAPNPGVYGSTAGSNWSYPTLASFQFLRSRGVTNVRLPIRWERVQTKIRTALDATEIARIQQVLADAATAGINVLVDLHNTGQYSLWNGDSYTITPAITGNTVAQTLAVTGANPVTNCPNNGIVSVTGGGGTQEYVKITAFTSTSLTGIFLQSRTAGAVAVNQGVLRDVGGADGNITQADLVDVWTRLSTALKGRAGLYGYDIMNEPKNIAAATWETQSNAVIAAIRANTDTTKIVVMGSQFGNPNNWTTRHPVSWVVDSGSNFVYECHYYFAAFSLIDGNFLNSYATEEAAAAAIGY